MKRTIAMAAAASLLPLLAACGSGSGSGSGSDTVTLGLLAPLTGGVAATAEEQQKAAELAVDQFNEDGGLDGQTVELKVYDTQLEPEVAAKQAQRAITQDQVAALLGPFSTSGALAVATIADRSKVATISGSASTAAITQDSDYMFRTAPLSRDLAAGLVRIAQKIDVKNAVLMHDSGGSGLAFKPLIESAAADADLELTQSVQYPLSASDVSAEVTKAARGNPSAVFIAGSSGADYGLVAKTMHEQGLDVPLFGFSPIVLPDAISVAGNAYEELPGVYTVQAADSTKPEYKELLKAYNNAYEPVDSLPEQVLGIYDATVFELDALKKTDGEGGQALVDALEELPKRVGANGAAGAPEQFTPDDHDAFGEGVAHLVPYKMVDGAPTQDTSLTFE